MTNPTTEAMAEALHDLIAYVGTLPKPRDTASRHKRIWRVGMAHRALGDYERAKQKV